MGKNTVASLSVRLGIDALDFESGLSKADKALDRTGRKMQTLGKGMSTFLTIPILGLGVAMTKAAIDAEETGSKFTTVFQDISAEAEAASRNLQDSYGLSEQSSKALLSATGDLLTGLGMEQEQALALSEQVNQLAIDLASFTNFQGGAEGASEALTKALLGERESVKSLGIVISEASVKERLAAEGKGKLTGAALLQAKAEATLAIAISQSKNAVIMPAPRIVQPIRSAPCRRM